MRVHFILAVAVGILLTITATPAFAGEHAPVTFASYTNEFVSYWREKARDQNAIVWSVVGVGIPEAFIIRSGGHRIHSH